MMLRVVLMMLVVGGMALGAIACDGGDERISDGQPDYAAAVAALLSADTLRNATSQEDVARVRVLLEQYASDWRELDPPPELRDVHDQYSEAIESLSNQFDSAASERVSEVEPEYFGQFVSHYDLLLLVNESASMEPAYSANDALMFCQPDATIERCQTIVFEFPLRRTQTFIRRVVALPGETIEIRDGMITIDGAPIEGDVYGDAAPKYVQEPLTVPESRYYVLGDSRSNSFDSWAWAAAVPTDDAPAIAATVPLELIEGELPPGDAKICPSIAER